MKVLILGGGQLARMLVLAAAPLGIRCQLVDPAAESCAAELAPWHQIPWQALPERNDLLEWADVITFESESVPAEVLAALAARRPVYPSPQVLAKGGDRWLEKQWLQGLGIPVADHRSVQSLAELQTAVAELGCPAFLKWRQQGYDGKGQWRLNEASDLAEIWQQAEGRPAILEAGVAFEREVSLVASRNTRGEMRCYPLTQNLHRNGILVCSEPQAADPLQAEAEGHARTLLETEQYVGTLAIEFFVCEGRLIANEVAPRVHNSGHWTLEGAQTSQFANHLRAICGWPLGETGLLAPTAMLNLISRWPAEPAALAEAGAHLHLYGKAPRPGRKVGHLTLRQPDQEHLTRQRQRLQQWLEETGALPAP